MFAYTTQTLQKHIAVSEWPEPQSEGIHPVLQSLRLKKGSVPYAVQCPATISDPNHTLPSVRVAFLPHETYLGIPCSLLSTLVEVYYSNVYNSSLVLHKRSFLEALSAGTVRPHVILGVCAWASKCDLTFRTWSTQLITFMQLLPQR